MKQYPFYHRCDAFDISITEAIQIVLARTRREPLTRSIPQASSQAGSRFIRKNSRNRFHRFTFGNQHA